MFMMTPYINCRLSVPTKDLRFSLPVYLFSVNIPVHRINFKSTVDVLGDTYKLKTWTWRLVRTTKIGCELLRGGDCRLIQGLYNHIN